MSQGRGRCTPNTQVHYDSKCPSGVIKGAELQGELTTGFQPSRLQWRSENNNRYLMGKK